MIRFACLLVMLTGCATSRPAAPPATLAEVNAVLDGATVQIVFTDGTQVPEAEWVRVGDSVTEYSTTLSGWTTGHSRPTAEVAWILMVETRSGSMSMALLGALPGALMAAGVARSRPEVESDAPSIRRETADFVRALGIATGVGIAVLGAAWGNSLQARASGSRYSVIYEGPVERYVRPATE